MEATTNKTAAVRKAFKVLALVLAGILAMAVMSGCSGEDSKEEQEAQNAQTVLEKLDALQTQMDGIESYLIEEEGGSQPEVVIAGLENAQQFAKQLDELEERVGAAAVTADSVPVPDSEEDRPSAYFEAIAPLEELELELEQLEDAFITAYGNGTVGAEELWMLKARKGEIEDMISLAEDSLEFRMGAE